MILAGIDEAGLGPKLGPLVTAASALRVPEDWLPETPWDKLAEFVSRTGGRRDRRLAVGDSKVIHKSSGMAGMEKTLGAFSILANGSAMFPLRPSSDAKASPPHPCYLTNGPRPPLHFTLDDFARDAETLRVALGAVRAEAVHLEAAPLHEPAMNQRFSSGLNKNQVLLMETGARLLGLEAAFPGEEILVVADKQGGRDDYRPFLTGLFPGCWLDALATGRQESRYRLRREKGDMTILFKAKGDRDSFATALASLAAKYVRERSMAELNAWFAERRPHIRPTAGYPEDAARWLAEMRSSGIEEEALSPFVRSR